MKTSAILLLGTVVLLKFSVDAKQQLPKEDEGTKKPNIVFIFTDDQDYRMNSVDYMPNVQKYLVQQGTTFKNHYATIALCCPSRVSLLRGQYAHNTNITDVLPPYGGYNRFNSLKLGEDYLPLWLQKAGYNTNYIGKLMNQYTVQNYNNPTPLGFDYQDQLVDPYTYVYNTAVFSTNGEYPVFYKDAYQTDIIHAKTKAALDRVHAQNDPFFLWVAPMAPHGQFIIGEDHSVSTQPPVPAARHAHLFKDIKIPRTPHFNPDKQVKTASYWKNLEKLNASLVEEFDEVYRNRLRALQSVDEIVGTVFGELEKSGELNNTFIIYSSDNGYHLGQHRSYPGKCTNIEEDINVPFIVRGPDIPKNEISHIVSSHHDLAPTFLALAKSDEFIPSWVDGGVIPLTKALQRHPKPVSEESFAVEFWGLTQMTENYPNTLPEGPNTYKTLRVIAEGYDYAYAVWCTGEHELYDLKKDPYEMNNLYSSGNYINGIQRLTNRLDALLVVLKSCHAESCRDPWRVLHPNDESVKTLEDALDQKYDAHYKQYKSVQFEECIAFLLESNEAPKIGSHFIANSSALPHHKQKNYSGKIDQFAIHSILKGFSNEQNNVNKVYLPTEYHDLFNLIPHSNGGNNVGQELPAKDFENHAIRIPKELVETNVNWEEYGFYSSGN